ncbi:MAG: glycoside hydrolase family 127 protein [Eubacteriales bacterium]|nr:glycoside hydrolase family 127 protein [Eubacteriales bacterium]MDD3883184.1 glycoside hydrolase family 127 protein [Eubacteriales bacterium]MDD4513345.1 glycoside hydrolase family 127 protein [Eubacteriales bacterium]
MFVKPLHNRAPLTPSAFVAFPAHMMIPDEKEREQLTIYKNRLLPVLKGGKKLPLGAALAMLPIAWLLGDDEAKSAVTGFFEKISADATMAVTCRKQSMLCRFYREYYSYTCDERAAKALLGLLKEKALMMTDEGELMPEEAVYASEYVLSLLFLYDLTGKELMLKMLALYRRLSFDWTTELSTFSGGRKGKAVKNEMDENEREYNRKLSLITDGVCLAQGVKTPAAFYRFSGARSEHEAPINGIPKIMKHYGTPSGAFQSDDFTRGSDPAFGISTEAAASFAVALGDLLILQGKGVYADMLDSICENALGAAMFPEGTAPYAQTNQAALTDLIPKSSVSGRGGTIPKDFSSCARLYEGLAQRVRTQFARPIGGGIAITNYLGASINCRKSGTPVSVSVDFSKEKSEAAITIRPEKAVQFPLLLRIPAWCENPALFADGEALPLEIKDGFAKISGTFEGETVLTLSLPRKLRVMPAYRQSVYFAVGETVYALPSGGAKVYAVKPETARLESGSVTVTGRAKGADADETLTLIPYAEAKLRQTTFAVIK